MVYPRSPGQPLATLPEGSRITMALWAIVTDHSIRSQQLRFGVHVPAAKPRGKWTRFRFINTKESLQAHQIAPEKVRGDPCKSIPYLSDGFKAKPMPGD